MLFAGGCFGRGELRTAAAESEFFLTYILLKARSGAKAAFIALLFATDKRTAAAEQKC